MTDFRPEDEIVPVVHDEKSMIGRVLLGVFLILAVAGGAIYKFRPDWIALAGSPAPVADPATPAPSESVKVDHSAIYQKYAMTPLTDATATSPQIGSLLTALQKDPCNHQTAGQLGTALMVRHATRPTAEFFKGFAESCPDSDRERANAGEIFYSLGEFNTSIKLASELINHRPDVPNPFLLRARAEQADQQYAAAVEDYATFVRLIPDPRAVAAEVFTRMADSYEKLGRICEAIGPIQTYIAIDSDKRSTPQLQKHIAELGAKGNCAQTYAKGNARIARRSNGVSIAKVQINGIEGTFVVDTGASFVTLTPGFAERAKPRMLNTGSLDIQTANGAISASLASVDTVKLAGLSASAVPAVVTTKALGDGIDGLLGMSFLNRFTLVMEDRDIQLKAKTLE